MAISHLALGGSLSRTSRVDGVFSVLTDNHATLRSVPGPEQPRPLRSAGITPRPHYYGPLRLLTRPALDFGFALYEAVAGRPRRRDRSPQLRWQSVTTCRPADPAAAPRHRGPLHGRGGFSLRLLSKDSACGLKSLEALLGSLLLRPAVSPPPHPRGPTV